MTAVPFRQPRPEVPRTLTHPSLPGVIVRFMPITPATATELLADNTHNRPPRPRVIASYARDMSGGNFPFNGDTICLTADGTLIDGQHRLQAIIDSGTSQVMLVVSGLTIDTQATKDVGVLRAFSDQLKLAGETHHSLLAAVTRKVALWEAGSLLFESNLRLSHGELAEVLDQHPELRASAAFASKHRGAKIAPSVIAMAHWLFSDISPEQADWFLSRVSDGVNLPANHSALLLRDRLQRDLAKRIKHADGPQLALLATAWNAYRDGRTGTHLKIPANLSSANFPTPR